MAETQRRSDDGGLTVRVFVRAGVLGEPIDAQLRRIRALEAEGVVDAMVVRVWPNAVRLSADTAAPDVGETEVVDLYDRFETWATRADATIEPAFAVQRRHSRITGESYEVLTTPVLGLAVYGGDDLAAVFPHGDADGTHSVTEGVTALAAGRFQSAASDDPAASDDLPSSSGDSCPDCGGDVADVQGIVVCQDCPWVTPLPTGRRRRPVPGQ